MTHYDCFNGDADGICALIQWRKHQPVESELVTGVKRDIALLSRVQVVAGDQVTAMDISFDKNREYVIRSLDAGASVFYCDHHYTGEIPDHDQLEVVINPAPDVCTSLLINGYIKGKYPLWAVVGASGDNLRKSAQAIARTVSLNEAGFTLLESLGIYVNYNGYGGSLDDLHFYPDELYRQLSRYDSPLEFIADSAEVFNKLESGYLEDMRCAEQSEVLLQTDKVAIFGLPDERWARRVSGVFGNHMANEFPDRAHAIVTQKQDSCVVSVRAPLNNKIGADEFCRQFPSGGGRAAAAGINALPVGELDSLVLKFAAFYA